MAFVWRGSEVGAGGLESFPGNTPHGIHIRRERTVFQKESGWSEERAGWDASSSQGTCIDITHKKYYILCG